MNVDSGLKVAAPSSSPRAARARSSRWRGCPSIPRTVVIGRRLSEGYGELLRFRYGHAARNVTPQGFVMAAHSAGRLRQGLGR